MKLQRIGSMLAVAAALITLFSYNLICASPYLRSWDEVDFVLALDRYDLLAMQPHFPGYPYFIAGGTFIRHWIDDPARALIVFNALLAVSSAIPISLLARRYVSLPFAMWAAVLVLSVPYLWLMGSRPMSECAGIALLWWFLWSIKAAEEQRHSNVRLGLALLLFSLLMGVRLSYFPFGLALLLLLIYQYKQSNLPNKRRRAVLSIAAAAGMQLAWIGGLVLSEGTLQGFWSLSQAFVYGHFADWGGGVTSSKVTIDERLLTLAADHLIRDIWFGRSILAAVLYLILILLVCGGIWTVRKRLFTSNGSARALKWLLICLAAYACWVLLGQNIEKPRHIAPVAGPLLLLLYLIAIRAVQCLKRIPANERGRNWRFTLRWGIVLALTSIISFQIVYGINLLQMQAKQPPAVYQLHAFLEAQQQPFILYTWEETRVLHYLGAAYEHRKIVTFDYFQAIAEGQHDRSIFVTDHVLGGFMQQDDEAISNVAPVAVFQSNSLFDPVYGRISLYEWRKQE